MVKISWQRIVLLIIICYEALGALVGGALLVLAPDGAYMDMPVAMMHGIFADFLIPGWILTAMGVISTFAFIAVLRKGPNDWLWACVTLAGWYIWFVTEIIILQELHWLHLMWALPVVLGIIMVIPVMVMRINTTEMIKGLLYCGIFSSLWYNFMTMYVSMNYEGYSSISFTVSELSAIGSPTRILWVLLGTVYTILFAALGWGIWFSSNENKALRITAGLIIAFCIFNLYGPPMHTREALAAGEKSLSNTLHLVWTGITVLFFICMMIFGAKAFSKKFRIYTVISILLMMAFGIITTMDTSNLEANLPTPLMGLWERICQNVFFIWVIVFATKLLNKYKSEVRISVA